MRRQIWNALAIPTTINYVAVMDPRYVIVYAPENVTVGPGERWPDIVIIQTGFQGAAESYWDRVPTHRSALSTVRYRPHVHPAKLSRRIVGSLYYMWRGIGEATGFTLLPPNTTTASGSAKPTKGSGKKRAASNAAAGNHSAGYRRNEDAMSYAVDALMKVRFAPRVVSVG